MSVILKLSITQQTITFVHWQTKRANLLNKQGI